MIYHKKLESDWEAAARELGEYLSQATCCTSSRVHIIGIYILLLCKIVAAN